MSETEYSRLGLLMNPFTPILAEERPKEILVIVGEEYTKIKKFLLDKYNDAKKKKVLNYVVLRGKRGTGKSAVIRDFIIKYEKDLNTIYFRLDRECSFRLMLMHFIKRIFKYNPNLLTTFNKDKVIKNVIEKGDSNELSYSAEVLMTRLEEIFRRLTVNKKKTLAIIWDQLENLTLEPGEVRTFLNFIRNISITLPSKVNAGVLFIISITPEKYEEIANILGDEIEFIRNLKSNIIDMPNRISFNETKRLFSELLSRVRVTNPLIKERLRLYPYYPFSDDAIKAIYDFADGIPVAIYELSSKVLDAAITFPTLEVIDEKFVHDVILDINPEWYKALTLPVIPLKDILGELLDSAKDLGLIRHYQRLTVNLANYKHIIEAFGLKKALNEKTMTKEELDVIKKRHILDYIIVYESEKGYQVTLVRTAKITIRGDIAKAISTFLNRISGFKYGISPIIKDRIKYVILTYGSIGNTVRSILEQASITSGIPVDIIEVNTNSPYVYGRIRSTYERVVKLKKLYTKLRAVPVRTRITLKDDVYDALTVLGIINSYE